MKNNKEIIIILDNFYESIQKLCHKEGCSTYDDCPQNCKCDNSKNLDFHTAILWDLLKDIEEVKYNLTNNNIKKLLYIFAVIKEGLSYHKDKYKYLIKIIKHYCSLIADLAGVEYNNISFEDFYDY